MKKTLQEIASLVGGRVAGDGEILISGLDNIAGAGESDLTFAVDPHIEEAKKYGDLLLTRYPNSPEAKKYQNNDY